MICASAFSTSLHLIGFELAPAIVGDLIPAARNLPPGNSLTEGYNVLPAAPPRLALASSGSVPQSVPPMEGLGD